MTDEDGDHMFVDMSCQPPKETYDDPRTTPEELVAPRQLTKGSSTSCIQLDNPALSKSSLPAKLNAMHTMRPQRMNSVEEAWTIEYFDSKHSFSKIPLKLTNPRDLPKYAIGHPTPNRYPNILPSNSTRVILSEIGGDPASTYINANHVKGKMRIKHSVPRTYIAAQAPVPSTVSPFSTHDLGAKSSRRCYAYEPGGEWEEKMCCILARR